MVAAGAGIAALGAASVATTKALVDQANATAQAADAIDKESQKIGMSKTAYQEWAYVMSQNGIEVDKLKDATKTLGTTIDGTSANGVAAMQALGLSFEGMNKEEAFNAAITALQGIDDETTKCSLATALFGEAYVDLMPLLNGTAEGTAALKQQAHDLGIVMSDEMVASGVLFGDTLANMNLTLDAVKNTIGAALLPILTQLMDLVIAAMPTITSMISTFTPQITAMFEALIPSIAQMIETLLPTIIELIMNIMPLLTQVFSALLPPLLDLINALLPPLTELIKAILPVIINLINALTPLFKPIINLLTPILDLAIALLAPLTEMISAIIPSITSLINALTPVLQALGQMFQGVAEILVEKFKVAFEIMSPIIDAFKGVLGGLSDFITGVFTGNWEKAWNGVKTIFSNVFDAIKALPKAALNTIINGINSFISGLNKIKIPDWVPGVGGKGFHINPIPLLANGGNVEQSGAAIVGEAGAELVELPRGARVTPLKDEGMVGNKNITQNNYFTQRELTPYETQLEVKRLSRNLAGAF